MRASTLAGFVALACCVLGARVTVPADAHSGVSAAPISIGILQTTDAAGAALVAGAAAAVAEVNAEGGVGGHPLELVRLRPPRPWRDGASSLARLVFARDLVALVGPSDGAAAHAAAQIATRARLPIITLSPEGALTRAKDPWVFRGVPDDTEQARVLLTWAFPEPRNKKAALAVPEGREGRERLASLHEACRDLGLKVATVIRVGDHGAEPGSGGAAETIGTAQVLLLWLDPEPALAFLRELGEGAARYRIIGSVRLDEPRFLKQVPPWADELALPMLRASSCCAESPDLNTRAAGRRDRETNPDLGAALGYDMLRMVAAAARRSGPDPGYIRDALASGFSVDGKSGVFHFDTRGNRRGSILVGVPRHGRLVRAP